MHLGRCPCRRASVHTYIAHVIDQRIADRLIKRANRTFEMGRRWNDVIRRTGVHGADADNGRCVSVDAARNDLIKCDNGLSGRRDRIDCTRRVRAVAAAGRDFDIELIRRGHERPVTVSNDARRQQRNIV